MEINKFATDYLSQLNQVMLQIDLNKLTQIIGTFKSAYLKNKHIFVFGNGGSGATASHLVCDLNKGVSYGYKKKFKLICLNDNIPTMMAYANDVDYADIFIEQLKNYLNPGDVVCGFSGSGNSVNVLKAIAYANTRRNVTIGFTGFNGGKLATLARISLVVPVNDMQKTEDVHLIITHILMQYFMKYLPKKRGK